MISLPDALNFQEHNVDVLVNNAGYAFIGGCEDTRYFSPEPWNHDGRAVRVSSATKWKSNCTDPCAPYGPGFLSCEKRNMLTSFSSAVLPGKLLLSSNQVFFDAWS